jgi:uncharacterized membrane protein YheB (UPF0754 family)
MREKETPEQEAIRLAKQTDKLATKGQRLFMNYEDKQLQNNVIQVLVKDYNYRLEAETVVTKPPFEDDSFK